ncbi:glycine--tRNA ligase subunit beta [Massilia sp. W12]|uniref:glycine--tRNA ligase subunit beta n=1 Tax=Massilia sp. W12 TaxID=3126507 RepID=UPI0030D5A033
MNHTLLVELFTEELPPKALAKLGAAFAQGIQQGLAARDLLQADAQVESFATPRRLAVRIAGVLANSPDKQIREKVLPVSVALDANGQPTAPLKKKLAAMGFPDLSVEQLERAPDGKAESFFTTYTAAGIALAQGLQAALDETLGKLPIPKLMTYQLPNGESVQFVRPAHRLLALLDDAVLPLQALGLQAGRETGGHRFLSSGMLQIQHANEYASRLQEEGKVIASFAERKEAIREALFAQAGEDLVLMPEALLEEVAALVEWPVVYACKFEEEFLAVPQECLILTMQTNQKYFALTDRNGKLRSRFLIVSNLQTANPHSIIDGNERVVRPRLSDAKFFFEQDKKKPLAARIAGLEQVVYHNKLGSQGARTARVVALAEKIAARMGWDVKLAARGAELAKADLLTDMVGEFPELQGIMGRYYARHDGEHEEVAAAAAEHYQPRFAGDALPASHTGTAVALADKLETLVGIWGIGLQPTGDKDPFALRRHALGILRMLVEKQLALPLSFLLDAAHAGFDACAQYKDARAEVKTFLYERLRGQLKERGFAQNEVEAVVAPEPDQLDTITQRLEAVQAFAALPQAASLAAANKRISNILKKTAAPAGAVDAGLLGLAAEQQLFEALRACQPQVMEAAAKGDFRAALLQLAALREGVDAFFNDVMVMDENLQLRNNRLALLQQLHQLMNLVADISRLSA